MHRGRPGCVVRACGEMVDVLWQKGQSEAAITLEIFWNELAGAREFNLLCGSSKGSFENAEVRDILQRHTHVLTGRGELVPCA